MRVRKGTILYAAGVLACGNVLLQVLGFIYRVVLSRFAGAEGLGVYRLVNSVYLVLNAGCLSGVTTACSRLSAACEARGESHRLGAVLRLAFRAFFALSAACTAVVLLCGLFMLYSGGARTIKLFGLPGVLPITGISTAWQYLPIPVAGFVMSFDSILFLTGIISRDDLLYSEPEVDFTDEAAVAAMTKEAEKK